MAQKSDTQLHQIATECEMANEVENNVYKIKVINFAFDLKLIQYKMLLWSLITIFMKTIDGLVRMKLLREVERMERAGDSQSTIFNIRIWFNEMGSN